MGGNKDVCKVLNRDIIKHRDKIMSSIYRKLPDLVSLLCQSFNGWIIGSSVDYVIGEKMLSPKDFDVVISYEEWNKASKAIPKTAVINSCGGFKVKDKDIEIDIWMDDIAMISTLNSETKAYHPRTQTLLNANKIGNKI